MRQSNATFTYVTTRTLRRPIFSLPFFIIITCLLLIAYGFWNMYNQEYQKQVALSYDSHKYQTIKELTNPRKNLINQSVTLGNVGVIDKIENSSYLISDGENVLIVIVPENLDFKKIDEKISNTPDFLTLRGVVKKFNQSTIDQYHLPVTNYPLLKKQAVYLQLSDTPEVDYKLFESNLLDNQETI